MSFTGDGVDQRLPAKGQLGLSAPVITARFCATQHKGSRLVTARGGAGFRNDNEITQRGVEGNSSARFHKSLQKMIIDAEINLTIIG